MRECAYAGVRLNGNGPSRGAPADGFGASLGFVCCFDFRRAARGQAHRDARLADERGTAPPP